MLDAAAAPASQLAHLKVISPLACAEPDSKVRRFRAREHLPLEGPTTRLCQERARAPTLRLTPPRHAPHALPRAQAEMHAQEQPCGSAQVDGPLTAVFTAETPGSDALPPGGVAAAATTLREVVPEADAAPPAPASSSAPIAPRASIATSPLDGIVVQPREMRRVTRKHRGTVHVLPVYRLLEASSGASYEYADVLHGGEEDDPQGACVALYRCRSAPYGALVVKTLWHRDNTGEEVRLRAVISAGDAVHGCMVPARVAQRGKTPAPGQECGPEHYTVVLMPYFGKPMTHLAADGDRTLLLDALRAVHAACERLLRAGLAYVDLKLSNVLCECDGVDDDRALTVVLCDYGGLAALGSPDAVASYPPPQHPRGVRVAASEATVMHGFGAMLVSAFFLDLEPSLRYIGRSHKRLRDAAPLTDTGAAAMLRAAKVTALEEVAARDQGLARVLRCAWGPRSTMRDLGLALQRAA